MLIFRLKLQITVSGGYLIALETVKVEFFQPPSKSVPTVRKEKKKKNADGGTAGAPGSPVYLSLSPSPSSAAPLVRSWLTIINRNQ